MPAQQYNTFDLIALLLWRIDANGRAIGQMDPDALPTAPATSHALTYVGDGISATIPAVRYREAEFGGSELKGRAFMGLETIDNFEVVNSVADDNLYILARGGKRDTTSLINAAIVGANENNPTPYRLGVAIVDKLQSRDTGTDGNTEYRTRIYPDCQCVIAVTGSKVEGGRNPNPVAITVKPSMAKKFPGGVAFGSAQGWRGNKTTGFWILAAKPYALTAFLADGVATTFITGYRGTSSLVTGGNTTNWFTKNGTPTAPASFVPATGVVTIAAGVTGDLWDALYQTDYEGI